MSLDPESTLVGFLRSVDCPTCGARGAPHSEPCRPLNPGGTKAVSSFHHAARRQASNANARRIRENRPDLTPAENRPDEAL